MKENLRPCIVNIPEAKEAYRTNINPTIQYRTTREKETHNGKFHAWTNEFCVTNGFLFGRTEGQISTTYGIVEYEDGTIHKVRPEWIVFSDTQKDQKDRDA